MGCADPGQHSRVESAALVVVARIHVQHMWNAVSRQDPVQGLILGQ